MFLYSISFYRFIIACLLFFEQKAEAPSGKIYVLRTRKAGGTARKRANCRQNIDSGCFHVKIDMKVTLNTIPPSFLYHNSGGKVNLFF